MWTCLYFKLHLTHWTSMKTTQKDSFKFLHVKYLYRVSGATSDLPHPVTLPQSCPCHPVRLRCRCSPSLTCVRCRSSWVPSRPRRSPQGRCVSRRLREAPPRRRSGAGGRGCRYEGPAGRLCLRSGGPRGHNRPLAWTRGEESATDWTRGTSSSADKGPH